MKKKVVALALLFACLFVVQTVFSACDGEKKFNINFYVDDEIYATVQTVGNEIIEMPVQPQKAGMAFKGWFEDKDVWEIEFVATSLSETSLSEDKNVYARWEVNDIEIKDFVSTDNINYFIKTANATTSFDFNDYISVSFGYTWFISLDKSGEEQVENNAVSLNVGDNLFYGIFIDSVGEKAVYSFNIRRRPLHTVTFNSNGGSAVESQLVEEDHVVGFVATPSKDGYIFNGWSGGIDEPITQDTQFDAQWLLEKYTINYVLNSGEQNGENPVEFTIESDDIILKPPTRAHYVFVNWFYEQVFLTPAGTIPKGSYGNKTLYAKWEPENYTITYELNSGINSTKNPNNYNIESPTIVLQNPERQHYSFLGWFDGQNNKVEQIATGSFGNITLHAEWTPIEYKIFYNNLEGTENAPQNPTTYNVEDEDFSLKPATKHAYDFLGWFKDKDLKTEIENIDTSTGANITLYAKFIPHEYQLTYQLNGGEPNTQNPNSYNIEQKDFVLLATTKKGYRFDGWFLKNNTKVEKIVTSACQDYELFAKWAPIEYIITYKNVDETENDPQNPAQYTIEAKDIELKPATREHYIFEGWFEDEDFETEIEIILTSRCENLELYAKFTPRPYHINYDLDKGTNNKANPATYTVADNNITLQDPTKDYYTFAGWFSDEDCQHKISIIETKLGGDVNVYAKWAPIEYIITYKNVDETENAKDNPTKYTIEAKDIELKPATRQHYIFEGWFEDEDFETQIEIIDTSRCENLELYAKFTPKPYNINYELDNGKNNPNNPETYTVENANIILQDPTKDYYTFVGWFSDEDCQHKISIIETKLGEDVNVYAEWTPIDYNITYEGLEYASVEQENPTNYNVKSDLALYPATRTGYIFTGWYNKKDGKLVDRIRPGMHDDLVLVAKWEAVFVLESGVIGGISNFAKDMFTSDLIIPAQIDETDIVGIGQNAFENNKSIQALTLPATIAKIGANAFAGCSNLKTISYLGSFENWLQIDFENAQSNPLSNPLSILKIGDEMIDTLTLTNDINNFAIMGWHGLSKIIVPASFNFDGLNFENNNITCVEYQGTIENWATQSFDSAQNNPLWKGAKLVCAGLEDMVEVTFNIGDYAFYGCNNIAQISMSFNTEFKQITVGKYAFANSSLSSIKYEISIDYLEIFGDTLDLTFGIQADETAFENCDLQCFLNFNLIYPFVDLTCLNLYILFPSSNTVYAEMFFDSYDPYFVGPFLSACVENGLNLSDDSQISADYSFYSYADLRDICGY